MYKNIVIIKLMVIIIIHQCTTIHNDEHSTTLEPHNNVTNEHHQPKPKPIKCGIKYLNETIGLSITNNHFYQFLLINETIQVIKYEYQKLSEHNDTKMNLINGHMLVNGLKDLIPEKMVEELMTVINWNDDGRHHHSDDDNEPPPIINCAMSINPNGTIHFYCLKSYDQSKYYVGEYNQAIDSNKVEKYFITHDHPQIRCTISNKNQGIISSHYSKSSFSLNMIKLKANSYSDNDHELKYQILFIDSSLEFIYQKYEEPNDEKKQELTKLFNEIFGPHTFTYGFVDENQIYLFSNQDETLISFSMDVLVTHFLKHPIKLQSYQDFFHCTKKLIPVIIDNNNNNKNNTENIDNNEFNISAAIMGMIAAAILVFLLLIGLFVYCLRKKLGKKNQYNLKPLTTPKQKSNLDGKLSTYSSILPTIKVTMTEKSFSNSSIISKTPISTQMSGKSTVHSSNITNTLTGAKVSGMSSSLNSSMSKTSATATSKVGEKLAPLSSMSKTQAATSKMGEKLAPLSSISKTPAATSKVTGKLAPLSSISKTSTTMKMSKV